MHAVCDAIDETSEGVKPVAGEVNRTHAWTSKGVQTPERLKNRKSVVGNRTAWSDFRYSPAWGVFITDELFNAMLEAGFNGFRAKNPQTTVQVFHSRFGSLMGVGVKNVMGRHWVFGAVTHNLCLRGKVRAAKQGL